MRRVGFMQMRNAVRCHVQVSYGIAPPLVATEGITIHKASVFIERRNDFLCDLLFSPIYIAHFITRKVNVHIDRQT